MVAITGAGSGIGEFLFNTFAQRQENVFGTCHNSEPRDERFTKIDIRYFDAVEAWATSMAMTSTEKIYLINCAGIDHSAFAHKSDPDSWARVIDVNLMGTYNAVRAFLPRMRERGFGRIVNFSSIIAEIGVMGTSAYAASKSALWGFSKAIAAENARKGITINNINLGYADIGMGLTQITESHRVSLFEKIPAGRFCSAEEILKTVDYLMDVEYINGTSICLNGGLA
jgi:NAD(P)-dependent dehydrogenase (short-subunit alcohol dehydrogenase family)